MFGSVQITDFRTPENPLRGNHRANDSNPYFIKLAPGVSNPSKSVERIKRRRRQNDIQLVSPLIFCSIAQRFDMRTIFFLIFSAYFLLSVIAVPLPRARVLPCQAGEISTRITCDISLSISPPTGTLSSEELSPQLEKRDTPEVGSVRYAEPRKMANLPITGNVYV